LTFAPPWAGALATGAAATGFFRGGDGFGDLTAAAAFFAGSPVAARGALELPGTFDAVVLRRAFGGSGMSSGAIHSCD
jgi:hypothetical protein